MPDIHTTTYTTIDSTTRARRTFYTPVRDAVAYLLSGIACALLVGYVAMLVAWIFASGGA